MLQHNVILPLQLEYLEQALADKQHEVQLLQQQSAEVQHAKEGAMADLAAVSAQLRQDRSSRSERLAALRQQVRFNDDMVCLSDKETIPYLLTMAAA